jgi:VanZ family protein
VFFSGASFWAAAAVVWTACVLGMTVSPLSRMEWLIATLSDKTVHAIAFGLGALTWSLALRSPRISVWTPRLAGAAISFVIGGLVEFLQRSVPGRHSDMGDFLANTIGILIVLGLLLATARYDRRDIKLK